MSKLDDFAKRLVRLQHAVPVVARRVAPELNALVVEEFQKGENPYGEKWTPLAPSTVKRKGSSSILLATRQMVASATARADGNRVTLTVDTPAEFPQAYPGTAPVRLILPDERGLPEKWREKIAEAFTALVDDA